MKKVELFEEFNKAIEFQLKQIDENEWAVIALKAKKEVGRLDFIKSQFKPVLKASAVNVIPQLRREGIATAMYQYAETHFGLKFQRNDQHLTADGKALWNSKRRPFGAQ